MIEWKQQKCETESERVKLAVLYTPYCSSCLWMAKRMWSKWCSWRLGRTAWPLQCAVLCRIYLFLVWYPYLFMQDIILSCGVLWSSSVLKMSQLLNVISKVGKIVDLTQSLLPVCYLLVILLIEMLRINKDLEIFYWIFRWLLFLWPLSVEYKDEKSQNFHQSWFLLVIRG